MAQKLHLGPCQACSVLNLSHSVSLWLLVEPPNEATCLFGLWRVRHFQLIKKDGNAEAARRSRRQAGAVGRVPRASSALRQKLGPPGVRRSSPSNWLLREFFSHVPPFLTPVPGTQISFNQAFGKTAHLKSSTMWYTFYYHPFPRDSHIIPLVWNSRVFAYVKIIFKINSMIWALSTSMQDLMFMAMVGNVGNTDEEWTAPGGLKREHITLKKSTEDYFYPAVNLTTYKREHQRKWIKNFYLS